MPITPFTIFLQKINNQIKEASIDNELQMDKTDRRFTMLQYYTSIRENLNRSKTSQKAMKERRDLCMLQIAEALHKVVKTVSRVQMGCWARFPRTVWTCQ